MAASQCNSKRYKSAGNTELGRSRDGVYSFHPEDEEIIKVRSSLPLVSLNTLPIVINVICCSLQRTC